VQREGALQTLQRFVDAPQREVRDPELAPGTAGLRLHVEHATQCHARALEHVVRGQIFAFLLVGSAQLDLRAHVVGSSASARSKSRTARSSAS
jgi:hypothetical protein